MKIPYIFLLTIWLACCASSNNSIWQDQNFSDKTFGIDTQQVTFEVQLESISDTLVQQLNEHILDILMNELLKPTLAGYTELANKNIKYTREPGNADLFIVVKSLILKKGLTINVTRPGPVYQIEVYTSHNSETHETGVGRYSGTANFAEMVGGDKAFYQPDENDLENTNYQLKTLDAALRKALGKVFKNYFGLKNYM